MKTVIGVKGDVVYKLQISSYILSSKLFINPVLHYVNDDQVILGQ